MYPLTASSTDVECAVKIGNGYSTNPSCQISPQITNRCEEGRYFCSSEGICKDADESCSIPVCNNDDVCDTYESCNCADCNQATDHCATNSNGQQLTCTKDTEIISLETETTEGQWLAYTYPGYASSYIYLTKLPVPANTVAGKTFYVYNPERIIQGMSEATFLADPSTAIKNATVVPVGNISSPPKRLLFNMAQLQSESTTTQATTIDGITTAIPHRYLCTENMVGATDCSNNGTMGWTPNFGTVANGDIYVSENNNASTITFTQAQKLGTFTVAPTLQVSDFTRFDTQLSFTTANTSPTIIGYDALSGRLPAYAYTFPGTGVTIRPNDSAYSTNNLLVSDLSTALPGKEIYVTGKEHFEINFSPAVNAFGFDFNESTTCRA